MMSATRGVAPDAISGRANIGAYQQALVEAAQQLAEAFDAKNFIQELGGGSADTKVSLLDFEDAADSALLRLNSDFVATIEALRQSSSLEQATKSASNKRDDRKASAEDAAPDLDAILDIYRHPIGEPTASEEVSLNSRSFDFAVNLSLYKKFLHVVFTVHDPEAELPTSKEAKALLAFALEEQRRSSEDDDIVVGDSVTKPVCLISSKLLEEPVRATCGHAFSKAYILDVIAQNGDSLRCPSRGCGNTIRRNELVRDRMMDLVVLKYLRKEQRGKQLEFETVQRVM